MFKNYDYSQMWWCTLIIPPLRRQRQEDYKCQASLGYTMTSNLNLLPSKKV
jgi:hypothetical protein